MPPPHPAQSGKGVYFCRYIRHTLIAWAGGQVWYTCSTTTWYVGTALPLSTSLSWYSPLESISMVWTGIQVFGLNPSWSQNFKFCNYSLSPKLTSNICLHRTLKHIYIYRTSCHKSLPPRSLRVIASCVNSNHNRPRDCLRHGTVYLNKVETIACEGVQSMKTGRVLQAISCPACRVHRGVQHA